MSIYQDFYNGENRSEDEQVGFTKTQNADVYTNIGNLLCQRGLELESLNIVNEGCIQTTTPEGITYFFSTTTVKRWKRTSDGTYTALTNGTINVGHLSAIYYNGYIYYTTANYLGRMLISSETFSDTFGAFSNQDALYHPMVVHNLTLFVGDGKYVASVNSAGTFTPNVLDLEAHQRITMLCPYESDLLIGTISGPYINDSVILRWDTYSSSWNVDDSVPEIGINATFNNDNARFFQCGTNGQIYYYTGLKLEKFKKIKDVTTGVSINNVTSLGGKPLIAIGTSIYSFDRVDKDFNYSIVNEYTASGQIYSINSVGNQLLVSLSDGVYKISTSYATMIITTPIVDMSPTFFAVHYKELNGATMTLESNVNNSGWIQETGFVNDSTGMKYLLQDGISFSEEILFVKFRITVVPLTVSPIIRRIEIT